MEPPAPAAVRVSDIGTDKEQSLTGESQPGRAPCAKAGEQRAAWGLQNPGLREATLWDCPPRSFGVELCDVTLLM